MVFRLIGCNQYSIGYKEIDRMKEDIISFYLHMVEDLEKNPYMPFRNIVLEDLISDMKMECNIEHDESMSLIYKRFKKMLEEY